MYVQEDLERAQKSLKYFVAGYVGFAVLFLGLAVLACVVRIPFLLYASVAILAAGSIFSWDVFGRRMVFWKGFVSSMLFATEREYTGIIGRIEADPADKRGMQCLRLHILSGDKLEDERVQGRIFYYEMSRPEIQAKEGDRVSIRYTDRYIKEVTILEAQE